MKIATMATGGIGGFLAVKLIGAGHQVATIARGAHLAAIRDNGLRLEGPDGVETARPWIATDDPAEVGPVDAILFGVKGDALAAAAEACRPLIGPQTLVVPFQNGVEGPDRLAAILPPENVVTGIARVSPTISAPGVIRQTGSFATFVFAERDRLPSARIEALQKALREAGVAAPVSPDIEEELWRKFVLFSAFSGVTAAARCTAKDIAEHPRLAALCRDVMGETALLGRRRGVALAEGLEDTLLQTIITMPPQTRASTAIDLEHGRPLEIEWISGAVARLAAESGVPAPLNAALYAMLLPYRDGAAG